MPLAGHAQIAVALWAVPAFSLAMLLAQVHPLALRYFSLIPILALALTVLTVSVLRRRRALEAEVARRSAAESALSSVNASLEQLVEARTSDLRNMIDGLESFNRSVSHDLRGPLGGIAGVARLASDALQRLVGAVVHQLALEQGGRSLPQIGFSALPPVQADPELLQKVLANLIGNAIKFTGEGETGRIEIGTKATSGAVEVFVRDNGVGFAPDKAASLFAPFVRLHGSGFAGHGIGLSIVRRAVERMGGRVWAESQPGQGATFSFSLPT